MTDIMENIKKIIPHIILAAIISLMLGLTASAVFAATNIDDSEPNHYAWSDVIGWIDFFATNSVSLKQNELRGYARYGVGTGTYNFISFDCSASPSGDICGSVDYKVSNDGNGNLSGWAWSDAIGWISFDCHNSETGGSSPNYSCGPGGVTYGVKVDNVSGEFKGWAWNDAIGWISFNCNQTETGDLCKTVDYRVKTAWRPGPVKASLISGTFDTDKENGVAFNYIVWRGSLPHYSPGGAVRFQLATSDCDNGAANAPACDQNIGWGGVKTSGDGAFYGPAGTTIETDTYNPDGPNIPVVIQNQNIHNNKRYYRYKLYIETSDDQQETPVVEDVIVNWSP